MWKGIALSLLLAIGGFDRPAFAIDAAPAAFPVAEPPFPAQLAGIDHEWNLSFKTAGKVRVVAAADLAYWGRYRDAEAGPQVILADGGVIRADALLVDDKQLVVGDATGLGRGLWDESSLPRDAVRAIILQPPAAAADRDRLWKELANYAQADDRLLLFGGETIAGTLLSSPRSLHARRCEIRQRVISDHSPRRLQAIGRSGC